MQIQQLGAFGLPVLSINDFSFVFLFFVVFFVVFFVFVFVHIYTYLPERLKQLPTQSVLRRMEKYQWDQGMS